jgi:hypothetical protein
MTPAPSCVLGVEPRRVGVGGRGVEVEATMMLVDEVMVSADLEVLLVGGEHGGGRVHWPGRGTARGADLGGHVNLGSRCAAIRSAPLS